uniref:RING-type domain-containing protein n=1 Tax=Setaria digitata TaxID=48799 RepID=A0A915PJD5_9BILA
MSKHCPGKRGVDRNETAPCMTCAPLNLVAVAVYFDLSCLVAKVEFYRNGCLLALFIRFCFVIGISLTPSIITIFNEPKQLHCGHSFCTTCIDRLYYTHETEQKYTCPLCRATFDNPPVINYSLKSLISRIKEKDAMIKCCYHCSKATKPEDQYCCDDCDHADRRERIRCGLCVINGHAKVGHTVSRYGELKERIKIAQQELQDMVSETVQLLNECKKLTTDRLSCIDDFFKLLEEQYTQFKTVEEELCCDEFVSKKDIEIRLEHARQLHEIYMRSASELAGFINNISNEISVLIEKTGMELASHDGYGNTVNKGELVAESAKGQMQSWFEYQRTGRVSALCSAIARRNAAIARRHLMTCSQSESELAANVTPPNLPSTSAISASRIPRNGILLVHQT